MRLRPLHLLISILLLAAGLVALFIFDAKVQPEPALEHGAAAESTVVGATPPSSALERTDRAPLQAEPRAQAQAAADGSRARVATRQRFIFDDGSAAGGLSADTQCLVDSGRSIDVRSGPTPTPGALDERGELEVEQGQVVAIGLGEHACALVPIEGAGTQPHVLPALVVHTFVVPESAPPRSAELELRITSVDLQSQFHLEMTAAVLRDASSTLNRSAHLRCTRPDKILLAACARVRLEPYETEVRRALPRGRYVVEVLRAPLELWSDPYEVEVTGGRSDLKIESTPMIEVEIAPELVIAPASVRLDGIWTAKDAETGEEKVIESRSVELAWRATEHGLKAGLRGESKTSKFLKYTVVIVAKEAGREVELRSEPRRFHQIPRGFLLDGRRELLGK